jgi:CHAT domain-containing protein/tetratricopeptide (TPR) repeat protein
MKQAVAFRAERRFREGAEQARRAVAIYETQLPTEDLRRAESLRLLGTLQNDLQDFKSAADTFSRELSARQQATPGDVGNIGQTMNELANTRRRLNQLIEAKELLQQALTIQSKGLPADDLRIGETAINLASLENALGDRVAAETHFAMALRIYDSRPEDSLSNQALLNKAALLNNFGRMYFNAAEFEKARPLVLRSIVLREKVAPNPQADPAVLLGYTNLAAIHQEAGELAEAVPLYERVLGMYERIPNAPQTNRAGTMMNFAMVRLLQGDFKAAEPLYMGALEAREAVLGPHHLEVAATLERIAVFHQVANRSDDAFRAMSRATEIHEEHLRTILMSGSDQERQAYMTTVQENLDVALSLRSAQLSSHADASTWAATLVMRRKGRVLDAATAMTQRVTARMTDEEQQLSKKLAAARSRLAALVLQSTEAPPGEREAQRRKFEADVDTIESELAARSREFAAELRTVDLAAVQKQLPTGTTLVEYVRYRPFDPRAIKKIDRFGEARYAAFVTSAIAGPRWFELGPAAPIERGIVAFRESLRTPSFARGVDATRGLKLSAPTNVRTAARDLGRLLLDPIQSELARAQRVLFAPDGELSIIPFAALQDSRNRFLVEQVEVGYLTSGRDLIGRIDRPRSDEAPLVVADPIFTVEGATASGAVEFPPLPGTAQEAEVLRTLIPNTRVLTGSAATERALKNVKGPRVLHVATHGFFLRSEEKIANAADTQRAVSLAAVDPQEAARQPLLRSGLALAGANQRKGGDGEDGLLTALEAASLDLRGTQLVVLSACETGLGEVRSGDGVYGLRRALTVAGAETQVMSLWQVSDEATRDLMIAFYKQLAGGAGRAAALRNVQLQLLRSKDWSHPFYWAAFVAAGAWEPLRGL